MIKFSYLWNLGLFMHSTHSPALSYELFKLPGLPASKPPGFLTMSHELSAMS